MKQGHDEKVTIHVVNGRLVGPTLADPGMDERIRAAQKSMFPDREAALAYFKKRGVLTAAGNLTKAFGG